MQDSREEGDGYLRGSREGGTWQPFKHNPTAAEPVSAQGDSNRSKGLPHHRRIGLSAAWHCCDLLVFANAKKGMHCPHSKAVIYRRPCRI